MFDTERILFQRNRITEGMIAWAKPILSAVGTKTEICNSWRRKLEPNACVQQDLSAFPGMQTVLRQLCGGGGEQQQQQQMERENSTAICYEEEEEEENEGSDDDQVTSAAKLDNGPLMHLCSLFEQGSRLQEGGNKFNRGGRSTYLGRMTTAAAAGGGGGGLFDM